MAHFVIPTHYTLHLQDWFRPWRFQSKALIFLQTIEFATCFLFIKVLYTPRKQKCTATFNEKAIFKFVSLWLDFPHQLLNWQFLLATEVCLIEKSCDLFHFFRFSVARKNCCWFWLFWHSNLFFSTTNDLFLASRSEYDTLSLKMTTEYLESRFDPCNWFLKLQLYHKC